MPTTASESILHVVASTNVNTGGPAVSVPRLADAVTEAGMRATLVCLDYPGLGMRAPLRAATGTAIPAGMLARGLRGYSLRLMRALDQAAAASALVHNHGLWMAPNYFARRVAERHRLPLVISPRGMLKAWSLKRRSYLKRLAWLCYERNNLAAAALLHATSTQECDALRSFGLRQPIAVIPNGVDVEDALPEKVGGDRRELLFMSRLHSVKGLEDLLQAWSLVEGSRAGWHLHIAGSDLDGLGARFKEMTRHLGMLDSVTFSPFLSGQVKRTALRRASLFILPSYSENFGIVVAEAMAAGLPVVTTTATPWARVIDYRCGWCVEPGVLSVRDVLLKALKTPQEELLEMGQRGRSWMAREFSWPAIGDRMCAVYRWVLNGGEPPCDVRLAR